MVPCGDTRLASGDSLRAQQLGNKTGVDGGDTLSRPERPNIYRNPGQIRPTPNR